MHLESLEQELWTITLLLISKLLSNLLINLTFSWKHLGEGVRTEYELHIKERMSCEFGLSLHEESNNKLEGSLLDDERKSFAPFHLP